MPCYLFTRHAYGSWLPDRSQGHVHWRRGREKQSVALASCYRQKQKEKTAAFDEQVQRSLIDQLAQAAGHIELRLHSVGSDRFHLHVLAIWQDDRSAATVRRSLRRAMTTRLNRIKKRTWFSKGESLRRVRELSHFEHLCQNYLPSHRGWKWSEEVGAYR